MNDVHIPEVSRIICCPSAATGIQACTAQDPHAYGAAIAELEAAYMPAERAVGNTTDFSLTGA